MSQCLSWCFLSLPQSYAPDIAPRWPPMQAIPACGTWLFPLLQLGVMPALLSVLLSLDPVLTGSLPGSLLIIGHTWLQLSQIHFSLMGVGWAVRSMIYHCLSVSQRLGPLYSMALLPTLIASAHTPNLDDGPWNWWPFGCIFKHPVTTSSTCVFCHWSRKKLNITYNLYMTLHHFW